MKILVYLNVKMNEESLYQESVELLKELISTQSFSFQEENSAKFLETGSIKTQYLLKDMLTISIATTNIIMKKNLIFF